MASWRGIQVAVKTLGEGVLTDEDKVWVGLVLFLTFLVYFFLVTICVRFNFLINFLVSFLSLWEFQSLFVFQEGIQR